MAPKTRSPFDEGGWGDQLAELGCVVFLLAFCVALAALVVIALAGGIAATMYGSPLTPTP